MVLGLSEMRLFVKCDVILLEQQQYADIENLPYFFLQC